MLSRVILISLLFVDPKSVLAFADTDCFRVHADDYTVRESVLGGEPVELTRQRAIAQLSELAIANAVGTRVKANSETSRSSERETQSVDDIKTTKSVRLEKMGKKITASSKGLVTYKLLNEEIVDTSVGRSLQILGNARVCIPKPTVMKDVVLIREALNSRGQPLPELNNALIMSFNKSPYFTVSAADDESVDAYITGRILEVSAQPVDLNATGVLLGESPVIRNMQRIRMVVEMKADYGGTDQISNLANQTKVVPISANVEDTINEFAVGFIQEAAAGLVNNILSAHKLTSPPLRGEPIKSPSEGKSRW